MRKKYELMIKSGTTQRAFRAPVYFGYKEALSSLLQQGWQGLYKGNFLGLLHFACTTNLKFQFIWPMENHILSNKENMTLGSKYLFYTLTGMIVDFFMQPIHNLHSRFILQNRLSKFYTYKSILDALKKTTVKGNPAQLLQGNAVNIPKNII